MKVIYNRLWVILINLFNKHKMTYRKYQQTIDQKVNKEVNIMIRKNIINRNIRNRLEMFIKDDRLKMNYEKLLK